MSFTDDLNTLHDFLVHTSENNLKSMLVGGKMTDTHLRLLMKIVKGTSLDDFRSHYEKSEFPRLKMSAAESAIKENFWQICSSTLQSRGLISKTPDQPVPVKTAA